MSSIKTNTRSGFTLIELLVIAPIAILVIAGMIGGIINLVGDALMAQQRNATAYQIQDGLDQIEQDIRLSSSIMYTTGTLTSPQGSDQATAAFTSNTATAPASDGLPLDADTALILSAYATTTNPALSSRSLVYTNVPVTPCPSPYTSNDPLEYKIVYYVYNGTLWRRTIVPPATLCGGAVAWQKNSCQPIVSGGPCVTNDRKVAENVSSVNVQYYFETGDPANPLVRTSLAADDNPSSVNVTIHIAKTVGVGTISSALSIYASRLNN